MHHLVRRALLPAAARRRGRGLATTPPLTKVVATIGPASEEAEPLQRCVTASSGAET